MATIPEALGSKVLEEYRLPDHESREPLRPLYVAGRFFDEVDAADDLFIERGSIGGRSQFEHLLQAFCDFRCSLRPLVGDLNRLMPTSLGVWSMHCPGLRIFGWVPAPHQFVAVNFARDEHCHKPNSIVAQCQKAVLQFARQHHLDHTISKGDRLALFPPRTG